MFTGIVTHRGRVARAAHREGGLLRLDLHVLGTPLAEIHVGDSVAVDGVCLTVAALAGHDPRFDVVPETLRRSTLGELAEGDLVNLERALRAGDALGGHWVQGHVDGVGTVQAVEAQGEDVRLVVAVPDALHADVLPKGSVTLDGVSLTVGEVWREVPQGNRPGGRFSVYLVPHTLRATALGAKVEGARVNVEADVLGRWVRHHLEHMHLAVAPPPPYGGGHDEGGS